MASSGAARPCVQRALHACRQSSTTLLLSPLGRPHLPLVARLAQAQARLASSDASPPTDAADPDAGPRGQRQQKKASGGGAAAAGKKKKELPVVRRRPNRDHNKQRGLSAIRRTGPREALSVSGLPLPRPVRPDEFPAVRTDPDHGLWGFFYARDKPLNTPKEDSEHGRAWNVEELRRKSWEDLHRLWWVCCKERNRISTGNAERRKGGYGYGDVESREREVQVRKTQNAIKHALTERFYAWEDAVKLAKEDPEIHFTEDGVQYVPGGLVEEDVEPIWEDGEEPSRKEPDHFMKEEGEARSHESVDPSITPGGEKTQQDAPRA